MKTRIIKTKIWNDGRFLSINSEARLLLLFLLTSSYVGMTNYFECVDVFITASTGLKDLKAVKDELQNKSLCFFYENWVFIPNLEKHNQYKNNPKNIKNYTNELDQIPTRVLEHFNNDNDSTPIVLPIVPIIHNTKIINHKSKIINIKIEEKQKIAEKYNVPLSFVESKADDILNWHEENPKKNKKENYVATLRNWVKRDALKIVDSQRKDNYKFGVTQV